MSSNNTSASDTSSPDPAAPSDLVNTAIREFAEANNIDPQMVLAGARFECSNRGMFIRHYGQKDPNGVVLMLDMGDYSDEEPEPFLRFALEHNVFTPAALHGYYGLAPGLKTLLFCVRIDLAAAESGAAAIAALVSSLANTEQQLEKVLQELFDTEAKDAGAQKVYP